MPFRCRLFQAASSAARICPGTRLFLCGVSRFLSDPSLEKTHSAHRMGRSLMFIAAAAVPFMSFIRSGVLQTNDWMESRVCSYSFHAPLWLRANDEFVVADRVQILQARLPVCRDHATLAAVSCVALVIGTLGTVCQLLMFRFLIPIGNRRNLLMAPNQRVSATSSQKAYISAIGYAGTGRSHSARCRCAVQSRRPRSRLNVDDHKCCGMDQTAIASDAGSG